MLHTMKTSLLWYVARSSGIVAWGALAFSVIWGLLMTTKLLGRRTRPAWMLDLHRYLGALAMCFTGVHILGIIFDTYAKIGLVTAFVPFADRQTTIPLTFGIVSFYMLAAVELTSLARRRLNKVLWRRIHLLSFPLFLFSTLHALTEGTDTRNLLLLITGGLLFFAVLLLSVFRLEDLVDPEPADVPGGTRAPVGLTANSQGGPRVS